MLNDMLLKFLPVILIFVLGYFLKRVGFLKRENGELFLKVVFHISLPTLILLSVQEIKLSSHLILLPSIPVLIMLITFGISYALGGLLHLKRETLGAFLVGTMILNVIFAIPFVIAVYGEEGLSIISLFDLGNTFMIFTFVYFVACKYGNGGNNPKVLFKKLALSPPIWALVTGIVLNLFDLRINSVAANFLKLIGSLTIPLTMLSLGIYFSPRVVKIIPLSLAIVIRMLGGLVIALILLNWLGIEGLYRQIILVGSSVPAGSTTLAFSSLEKLDTEFASSLVSFSILIGIFLTPFLILWHS